MLERHEDARAGMAGIQIEDPALRRRAPVTRPVSAPFADRAGPGGGAHAPLALFILASAMLFASPQALMAQESQTFVKNNSQSTNSFRVFSQDMAQGFTAGDNAAGYTLTRATIYVNHAPGSNPIPVFTVGVWSESSGRPDRLLQSLTPPDSNTQGGNVYSTTGLYLAANTDYFIVVDVSTDGVEYRWIGTSSDDEDASRTLSGWSIYDHSTYRSDSASTGAFSSTTTASHHLRLDGVVNTALPTPAFGIVDASAEEGDSATFTVTLSPAATEAVTVDYATSVASGDTAVQADFTANNGTLTFMTGDSSKTFTVATVEDTAAESDETFTVTLSSVSPAGAATLPADPTAMGTITDDDTQPALSISVDNASIDEAAGASTVTISTGSGPTFATEQTISLALAGSATKGSDYGISSESLTLAAGATSTTALVTAMQDNYDDDAETIIITASNGGDTIGTATVTITDDDNAPTFTLSVNDSSPSETGEGTAALTVRLGGSSVFESTQVFNLELSGTATLGDDYTLNQQLSFPANVSERFTVLKVIDDNYDEDAETVVIAVTHEGTTVANATITIGDDDNAPVLSVAVNNASIAEAAGTSTLTVSTGSGSTFEDDQTIALARSGTAMVGDDYTMGSISLTLPAGVGHVASEVTTTITAVQDRIDEPDETILIDADRVTGSSTSVDVGTRQTVTITDDDQAALTIADAAANEGDDITFTVTLDPVSSREVTVGYATSVASGDTAVQADFTANSGTLTFAAGDSSKTFTVATAEETTIEPNETFTVTLSGASGATLPADATATGTITDDDSPQVSISVNNASIAEDGGASTVTISTGSGPTFATEQTITLTLTGTAGESRDYVISSESLTLAAGATTVTATVTAVDDNYDDDAETVIVTASNGGDDIGSQTITITDDDDPPAFSLIVSDSAPSEAGAETSMLTVSLGSGSVFEFSESVSFELSGTAEEKGDYNLDELALTIEGGENMVSTTLDVVDDNYDDDAETVVIDVVYGDTTVATGTITITDDDDAPVLSVAVDNASIAEAAGASTVTVSTGSGATFEFDETITLTLGGTATTGVDYTIGSTSLTLPYGDEHDASEVTTTITAVQDRIDELDETILIDAAIGQTAVGTRQTVTITDDDQAALTIADAAANEGDDITFTVTLDPVSSREVTVDWATSVASGDTAAQADFTADSGTLTFAAGDSSKTFTVATAEETTSEPDETFTVTLSNASGATLPADATATGTITDDDQAPLSIADASADEGDSATFTVTLNPAAAVEVTVDYATSVAASDTAAQSDFTAKNGTLTFAAGDTTESFTVATLEDSVDEVDETFTVTLSNVSGSTLPADPTATGTIIDDDQAALTIADAGADEGDDITFTVTLNPTSSREVKVDWATSVETGDTAVQADFTAGSDTLTFAAGDSSKTFTVATTEETALEPDETFTVTLSDASEATLPADPTATGTIGDDDTPRVSIASGGDVAQEGTAATFTLTMSPAAPTGGLTVNVTVAEVERRTLETGELAYDFVAAASEGMKTVDFAAGDTAATLTVPTVDDDLYEAEFGDDNLLRATLAAGTGYAVATGSGTAELTLRDGADRPVATWKTAKVTVTEGTDRNAALVLTLSHALVEEAFLQLVDIPGTASKNNDYVFSSDGLTFAAGTTEATALGSIVDDTRLEGTEDFNVRMSNDAGIVPVTLASETDIVVDILDTDTMQLDPSAVSARVVEGDSIQIKIDTTPSGACNYNREFFVTVTPSGDTATLAAADAVEQRFGACVSTQTVSFATEEDTDVTANRALSFTLATKAGTDSRITVVTDNVVEVAVIDDDGHATGAPAIAGTAQVGRKLTASPGTIADGDGLTGASYTYTWFRVDGATETEITGTTGNGYTPVAADQGKTLKVRASFTDDEGFDEQRDSAATATVATAPTTPTFGIADASADEGESITFTVTLNPAAGAAATVAWATSVASGDTAVQADFTAGNGTLNFGVGDTSKTITVATVEDTASEADETFTVTLSSASSGTALPSDATATGTIGDDDTRRVSIASGGDVASEGAAATFTLTMSPAAPAGGLTVNVTVAEVERRTLETGELAYDLVAAASEGMKTVTFAAGDTSATLTVPTVDDDLYEAEFGDDNLLRATLAAGTGYAVAAGSGTAELTLSDGADRPVVSWKTAKVTVTEGTDTNAALVLTLSHALVEEVAFTLIAVPSSASSGSDFTFVMEDADFAPGTTEVTTLVPIVDSPQHLEATEVFNILIAHAVASQPVAIPGTSSIQVEILDPDTMQVDPTAVSARVVEGDAIQITIDTLPSGICPHFGEFFVTVTPSGDTATLADADAVEHRFAPCVSTQTVSFATREDTDVTANRALSFTLATKAGTDSRITVVTGNVVEVAVIDDDRHATGAPVIIGLPEVGRELTASPGTIADGDGLTGATYTYTWIRGDHLDNETLITGTTGNGYTPVAADEQHWFKVRASFTDDEGFNEQRESAETSAATAAPTTPTFSITGTSAAEGESITFIVTLNPAASAAATVAWATSVAPSNTAVQADFTASSGTLNFAVGDTSKTFTVATVEDTAVEPDENFRVTLSSASSGTLLSGLSALGTILNDDVIGAFAIADASAAEGDAVTFTVTHTPAATQQVTVDWATSVATGDTAAQTDFTAGSGTLTFAVGDTSKTFTVATVEDTGVESSETFTATLSNVGPAGAATLPADATATGTITDDDTPPVLSISVNNASIAEAAGTSTVTISTGSGPTFASAQTITLALTGTATETGDYSIGSKSLTLAAGTSSITTTVTAVDDNYDDDAETVVIAASNGGDDIGSQTITITDDDDPPAFSLIFQGNRTSASETGAEAVSVTVSLGGSVFESEQTLSLEVSGTAREGVDYNLQAQVLTLFEGLNLVGTRLTVVDDNYDDDAETVVINVVHEGTTVATGTITITDDDDPPAFSLIVSDSAPSEAGEETSMLTVSLGSGSVFEFNESVSFELSGTAVEKDDYDIDMQELTIVGSENMVSTTLTVVDDNYDDDAETVVIDVVHDDTTVATGTITITDDDDAPVISLLLSNSSPSETGAEAVSVTVTLSGSVFESDQTFSLEVSGTARVGVDYNLLKQVLTLFEDANLIGTRIDVVDDNYDDDAETVVIDVVHEGTTVATGTITITDDDDAPVLSVTVNNADIAEAAGDSTVTVSTGSGSTFEDDQTITLTLGGTATTGDDYTIGSTSLTLPAGSGTAAASIATTITAVQDRIDDDAETIIMNAALGSGLSATAIGSATVTIADDDDAPVLSVSVNNASVAEAAGTSTVTVGTDTGSTFATAQTITLSLTGTATEGDDFGIGSKTLTLPAGSGTAAASIATTITAVQDRIDDDAETILIDADRATGVSTSVDVGTRQTVTIADDDDAPVLSVSVNNASVAEAAGASTVTVGTDTGSTFATAQTITLSLTGTATEGDDFSIGSKTLTLPAGSGTAAASIATTITAVQDKIDDDAETIVVTASDGGDTIGTQQTVTITDDDAAPVLSLDVSSATIAEAAGTSTVTVGTGTGSTFATDQTIALALGGTATVIDDYSIGATTLTLPAGVGTAAAQITTTITAVDDDFFEGTTNERLTVTGSRGGTDFGAARIVTITENEMPPKLTLTFSDDSISEDGGSTTVTASVAPRTVDAFTVTFGIAPNAPATAADYDLVGTLAFAALSATPTGTVTVTANNNRVDRPDKTVAVTATSSESYFRATDAVTLTLEDEDAAPAPVLEVSVSPIAEDAGASTVTVTTGAGSTFPEAMTVTLSLTGSATETADYGIVSKSLTLPAGSGLEVSTVTTTVTGVDDIIDDDAETVLIDAAIGTDCRGRAAIDRDHRRRCRAGADDRRLAGRHRGERRNLHGDGDHRHGLDLRRRPDRHPDAGGHGRGERRLHHHLEVADPAGGCGPHRFPGQRLADRGERRDRRGGHRDDPD